MCKDINKKALDWALSKASQSALDDYNKFGKKLVFGDDYGSEIAGPIWLATSMKYTDNKEKTETTVVAPYLAEPDNFFLSIARGVHYCKLLNPSRALEWIYVDS